MSSTDVGQEGVGQTREGISIQAFLTAFSTSLVIFGVQSGLFLLLRNRLARIFKPKTYLVPQRERTDPPPRSPWGLIRALLRFPDREIIKKCGLDSYFFLRYLQTLLIIFIPIACIVLPILIPLNYVGGRNEDIGSGSTATAPDSSPAGEYFPTGLDTLAWSNIQRRNADRYWAHLILALMVILWVCGVVFAEMRVYIKIRQDWLTTAEHRLRASATTVLVSGIPDKWLNETALRGLFDVFPGGIRNIWLTRDLTQLLEKVNKRDLIHRRLEAAETELIREAKRQHLRKRELEEKAARKSSKSRRPTKEERLQRQMSEDVAARMQAQDGQGLSSGDRPVTSGGFRIPGISNGISKLTSGIGKGLGVSEKTGPGIIGGARNISRGLGDQIETTNGFVPIVQPQAESSGAGTQASEHRHLEIPDERDLPQTQPPQESPISINETVMGASATWPRYAPNGSIVSGDAILNKESIELRHLGNTTRKLNNIAEMYDNDRARWYEFWKPPTGGFASPVPQGYEGSEFPSKRYERSFWAKVKSAIPFLGGDELEPIEYPKAYSEEQKKAQDQESGAEWEKWVRRSRRPTHRLAIFEWTPAWFPGIPGLNKKVDTIYWCREELARLNLEIEIDQNNPERYPLMKSAFIQFNHQVAAHMACQSVIHHIPKHMAPRTVEISPNDVLWDNMAIPWWSGWLRTAGVFAIIMGMIILWTFPVAFSSSLSKIDVLIEQFPWLRFLESNVVVREAVQSFAGVLPALLLVLLLWLVPIIMDFLAGVKGAKTGAQKTETVQQFYFAFLFVQVFFVVSFSSGLIDIAQQVLQNPASVTDTVAKQIPKAANYFFSYMILQALSVSSGTLLQIGALISWYVLAKIMNNTTREKWAANTTLPDVKWGSYFPVYTNFACIGLIYCIVAPLISLFAMITFSLLWVANRYSMIYVNRLTIDTGGVLYPRALNQTFTGLYFMEVLLIGLFFLVRDDQDRLAGGPQALIMIIATVLTATYQILLNKSFGPLFRYLPITFEDEAVLRDEAFQRAQDSRLRFNRDETNDATFGAEEGLPPHHHRGASESGTLERGGDGATGGNKLLATFGPMKDIVDRSVEATNRTVSRAGEQWKNAHRDRRHRRREDLEAQRAIGEALYGGFHDEIEDLMPEERDKLVRRAFMHSALRARRPTVWIPRDDMGVSDDEIRRTKEFSEHIWISNEGTALDSKARVVYGRAPPDFSEMDIITV
ncbi:hypothetical protein DL766_007255 [Monosporascus sp. MC13-8B]|uniref:CSC1/OSCA1-like 7TM region domain-containing protein n=1 Tax=Monosporascus cannonballus TaxID=155416 RepID=A0ABY0H405_9PEZI|nr:hypothetical protein DL762_006815 [Monosporascus cannonballus]RYO83356.1 hypothetical protein DL763_007891 [Monosporascus cannonballus]RYP24561.1 hypothetical protein DL766_007255 [Monosporascus sp. MC13-8B]